MDGPLGPAGGDPVSSHDQPPYGPGTDEEYDRIAASLGKGRVGGRGPTLIFDSETMPLGWELLRDELDEGTPIERASLLQAVAVEHALRTLVGRSPPLHWGATAKVDWLWTELRDAKENALKAYHGYGKDPKRGQILCTGFRVLGDTRAPTVIWEDTERGTLQVTEQLLEDVRPSRIVAWRGERFDFPFMWERAIAYELPRLARWFVQLHYQYQRQLSVKPPAVLVDPHKLWQTVQGSSDNIADVVQLLGIRVDNPITGADVFACMLRGESAVVRRHLEADVVTLDAVWARMAPALGVSL